MAENVIYEDTPFAQYLAEIGSEEEVVRQPEPNFESEHTTEEKHKATFRGKLLSTLYETIGYLKEQLSTALPLQEENQFEERFKYILCTSHLLNEAPSIHFYDSRRPSLTDITEAGQYFGGLTRRNFEILLSSLVTVISVFLAWVLQTDSKDVTGRFVRLSIAFIISAVGSFWLYRHLRRKAMKTLHDSALHLVQVLVYNCQTFDLKVNKALIMIQEIELVSRGYRLSMPLSPITRIEQSSKTRRCIALRDTIHAVLREAFMGYRRAIMTIQPEISQASLNIMYNMYNIPSSVKEDDWNMDDVEDPTSLENLRLCFQKMHSKRRECLCHLLALDVMTSGRDSNRRDYEQHWTIVNEHINELGSITGHYLDTVIASSTNESLDALPPPNQDILSRLTPFAPDKRLRAYLHKLASMEQYVRGIQAKLYLCNEDARKYYEAEGFVDPKESELLMNQYNSIAQDFSYMVQEWEEGKQALIKLSQEPEDPDTPVNRRSLEVDMSSQDQESTENDENSSERTLIDWTQLDEPLDVPEQYFEAIAEPEVAKQKLTREERIVIQRAKKAEEAKIKAARADSERMVRELKDVLLITKCSHGHLDPFTIVMLDAFLQKLNVLRNLCNAGGG
ncbi:2223_t:CDS:10 [Ambispora leptoticha]|uniref:Vezatin n=1 Tax=Ambispora leptoticha TaxID=144679 RepID=A0A9N8VEA3_9GLOM|nr:2223_t:CDS:10 [Ambispora leptoticha]